MKSSSRNPLLGLAVLLGLRAGLRQSEVLGLRPLRLRGWRAACARAALSRPDRSGQDCALEARGSVRRAAGDRTQEVRRCKAMAPPWRASQAEALPSDRAIAGERTSSREEVMDVRVLRRWLLQALDDCEIALGPKPFHRLRHTFVSNPLIAGVPTYWVTQWAGHTSTAFTERAYGHWIPQPDQ